MKNKILIPIILVFSAAAVILMPLLISIFSGSDFFYGEAKYHLRISKLAPMQGFGGIDYLTVNGQKLDYGAYHAILHFLTRLLPQTFSVILLGLITGVITIFLYYLALLRLGLSDNRAIFACAIVLFSPEFIELFGTANPIGIGLMGSLLGFMLYQRKDFIGHFLAFISFFFAATCGPIPAIGSAVLLVFSVLLERKRQGFVFLAGCAFVMTVMLRSGFLPLRVNGPADFPFGIIADLGFSPGIGIFSILTAIVGTYVLWKRKMEYWPIYVSTLILFLLVFFFSADAINYLMFSIAVFSAAAIFRFIEGSWEFGQIRNVLLVVILCGFMFSFVSYASSISARSYDQDLLDSLRWLKSASSGAVLTAPKYSYLVQSVAEKPVFLTPTSNTTILFERNSKRLLNVLNPSKVKYIVIDDQMRNGLIWKRDDEGLLFALRDQNYFKLIHVKGKTQVWALTS